MCYEESAFHPGELSFAFANAPDLIRWDFIFYSLGVEQTLFFTHARNFPFFQYRGGADFLKDRSLRQCRALHYTEVVMNRYAMYMWNTEQNFSHTIPKSARTLTHQCLLSRSPSNQKKKIDRARQQSGRHHDDQCTRDTRSSITCYKNIVGRVCRLSGAWLDEERRMRLLHRRLIPTHPYMEHNTKALEPAFTA